MSQRYNLINIRNLLSQGFSAEELRRLTFYDADFRRVYDQLSPNAGKAAIIDQIIDYAEDRLLLDKLLAWARAENPARYNQHQPYAEPATGPTTPPPIVRPPTSTDQWDVFISHAGEDKDFVRALAQALERKGLRVWFDELTLRVGDSLRRSIDRGLANSKYGIVVLSPNFFKKQWPQWELDGLLDRQIAGQRVILPIWHKVTADQVRQYSPSLAGIFSVSSDRGLEQVVAELIRAIE